MASMCWNLRDDFERAIRGKTELCNIERNFGTSHFIINSELYSNIEKKKI